VYRERNSQQKEREGEWERRLFIGPARIFRGSEGMVQFVAVSVLAVGERNSRSLSVYSGELGLFL
jgi:hypothetical protein